MSAAYKAMVAGYSVEAHPQRVFDHALVTMHKLGSGERASFTPKEGRELARILLAAADKAEGIH